MPVWPCVKGPFRLLCTSPRRVIQSNLFMDSYPFSVVLLMEVSLSDVYYALQVIIAALGILSGLVFTLLWRGKWFS